VRYRTCREIIEFEGLPSDAGVSIAYRLWVVNRLLDRKAFSSLDAFLERLQPFLDLWPSDVPVALEIRNKAWVTAKLLHCLRARRVVFALTDQAWMPSPLSLREQLDVVTGPFGYVRLLGDRKAVDDLTPTLDHIVSEPG
jgi:uncharacterized protein YecE (DUF72 family)